MARAPTDAYFRNTLFLFRVYSRAQMENSCETIRGGEGKKPAAPGAGLLPSFLLCRTVDVLHLKIAHLHDWTNNIVGGVGAINILG